MPRKHAMSIEWAMPSKWTFTIPPIAAFLERHLQGRHVIVDPFCGESCIGTFNNDLARGWQDATTWLQELERQYGCFADAVVFDPPYSPRQIAECYASIGKAVSQEDTQNARLFSQCIRIMDTILKPGGIALSFGWQSSGFGRRYETTEVMLVQHGGAHNDTICVAQRKLEHQNKLCFTGGQP